MKIASIVGTRPNFMKIAPLVTEFKRHKIGHVLIHTGQHYDFSMSRLFFEELGLPKPDEHLVCQTGIGVDEQRSFLKKIIKVALERQKPDLVIVVGDVNSTVAGAEAAHELGIKVAHVEAGLRSFDNTMPEEINRIRTDKISDFLFTTEKSANKNLLNEGISRDKIFFVGNVMIDTLLSHRKKAEKSKILGQLKLRKKGYCVLTLHRPSNVDNRKSFENILDILEAIGAKIKIVFPLHPRTKKNLESFGLDKRIRSIDNLIITKPLGYLDFLCLMSGSRFVLTDSGGIQEETTVLGVPCVTLRNNTERPVTISQGTNMVVSTDKAKITRVCQRLIKGDAVKAKIPQFWDGKAAERIFKVLTSKLN
ncbi:UDP-N-acetylglucosamine 2-epimerase (non-hydrolyzing) [Candidatus Woesearchaeota archaeon]|nr:UDP-N-acetylglucosamine 2-epimerase (non-hydrolyzing) [Candidatus Woesearchaeota archaeon]